MLAQTIEMDNGIEGQGRVERTMTGFTTTIYRDNDPDATLTINRTIDLEGGVHIDVIVESMDDLYVKRAATWVEEILSKNGFADYTSRRADGKVRVSPASISEVIDIIAGVNQ